MAEIIIGEMLASMPFRVFAYIPFRNHLRVPKKLLVLLLIVIECVSLLMFGVLLCCGASEEAAKLVQIPISLVAFLSLVRMERGKIMFIYVFTVDYILAVRGTAMFVEFYLHRVEFSPIMDGLLVLGIFAVSVPFVLHFINKTAQMVVDTEAKGVWRTVWILPTLTSTIVMMYTMDSDGTNGVKFLLTRVILLICMFITYYWIIEAVSSFQKKVEADEHIDNLLKLSAIQESQYETIRAYADEWRHFRHDLRQNIRVIMGCIDSGDISYLREYITQYGESLPPERTRSFCKSAAMDAVLRCYSDRAYMRDVDFEADIRMEKSPIPEHELCVLLGNLLENAIDAAASAPEHRYVNTHIRQNGSMLTITVDNTSPQAPITEDGRLLSTKHEGDGIGTKSVAIIAERYNGDARFEWKDGVFCASVMLNP